MRSPLIIKNGKERCKIKHFLSIGRKKFKRLQSGMSRMTGINKAQLSQYVCGKRHPSPRTQEKIKRSVQKFAEELSHAMA